MKAVRINRRVHIIGLAPSELTAIVLTALLEGMQVMRHYLSRAKAVLIHKLPCIKLTPRCVVEFPAFVSNK